MTEQWQGHIGKANKIKSGGSFLDSSEISEDGIGARVIRVRT